MRLSFDTIEEVLAFVERLKKPRTGKNAGSDEAETNTAAATGQAPQPLQPPQGGPSFGGAPAFTPPASGPAPSFPGAQAADPQIAALVARISARMDAIIQSGQTKSEDMLTWFRQQVVQNGFPEAGQATLDQIKGAWLAKLPPLSLDTIAKTIAA